MAKPGSAGETPELVDHFIAAGDDKERSLITKLPSAWSSSSKCPLGETKHCPEPSTPVVPVPMPMSQAGCASWLQLNWPVEVPLFQADLKIMIRPSSSMSSRSA